MLAAGLPIVPVIFAVVFALLILLFIVMWIFEPWWHSNPSPRRAVRDAIDQVRIMRIRRKHPDDFVDIPPPHVVGGVLAEKNSVEETTSLNKGS